MSEMQPDITLTQAAFDALILRGDHYRDNAVVIIETLEAIGFAGVAQMARDRLREIDAEYSALGIKETT